MRRLKMWQVILAGLGTIILLGVLIIGISSMNFKNSFNISAQQALPMKISNQDVVTEADLLGLPEAVQRYFHYTGVIGKDKVTAVRLKQVGSLRQTPQDTWKDIEAVQYYSIDTPSFVWMGQMAIGPFSIVSARDSYIDGHGRMFIKMLGVKTIGDVQGEEMDYSGLVRYLNEMMWFPTAFFNDNISWESIDNNSAKVIIKDNDKTASAILHFDDQGAITNFTGQRYHEVNGVYVKDIWETPITGYGEFNGLKLPVKGEAVWRMSSGDFSYIKVEVTTLEYNIIEIYK